MRPEGLKTDELKHMNRYRRQSSLSLNHNHNQSHGHNPNHSHHRNHRNHRDHRHRRHHQYHHHKNFNDDDDDDHHHHHRHRHDFDFCSLKETYVGLPRGHVARCRGRRVPSSHTLSIKYEMQNTK